MSFTIEEILLKLKLEAFISERQLKRRLNLINIVDIFTL